MTDAEFEKRAALDLLGGEDDERALLRCIPSNLLSWSLLTLQQSLPTLYTLLRREDQGVLVRS